MVKGQVHSDICIHGTVLPNLPFTVIADECPHNGQALMLDGNPRTCVADIECQGSNWGSFSCQQGYCCPQSNGLCILVRNLDIPTVLCVKYYKFKENIL